MNLNLKDNGLNTYTKSDQMEQESIQDGFGGYDELRNDNLMNQFEEQPYVLKVEQPKKKSIKEIFSIFILILMVVGISGWCLISGFKGMFFAPVHPMDEAYTNLVEGDVYEGTISYITPEIGELKHSVNFIPAGTEHFYLMFSEDGTKVITIRASKKWDNQFTDSSLMEVSLQERGIVREMDYKVKSELMSPVLDEFAAAGVSVEKNLYLDLNANKMCGFQIFTGISIILCSVYFTLAMKRGNINKESLKTPVAACMSALLIITMGMIIYLMNMVGF